jgi:hypothetical protein
VRSSAGPEKTEKKIGASEKTSLQQERVKLDNWKRQGAGNQGEGTNSGRVRG